MKTLFPTSYKKRAAALFLACLLTVTVPFGARAEELLTAVPAEEAVETAVEAEEAEEAIDMGESVPMENRAEEFADSSLLVTGGHATYMNGYPGAMFMPSRTMMRSEAAQMLYNLLAAKAPVAQSQFPDVSLNKWYGTAVNSLAKAGVFSGYKDGTFGPSDTITRAQFVTALSKCFDMEEGTVTFPDVPETHWAYKYVSAAATMGWIKGTKDGLFQPDRGITRAEAVTVMNAALGRTGEGFAADRDTQKFKDVPKSHWAYLQIQEAAQPVDPPPQEEPGEDPAEEPDPDSPFTVGMTVKVTASGLNLREAPVDGKVITVLYKDTVITVTEIAEPPWIGVKTSGGLTGYVSSEYVQAYDPSAAGTASGASLSDTSLSVRQYQSALLDAYVSSGTVSAMKWTSSDASVAVVGYTLSYGTKSEQGAVVYGKKPGTATLTFTDSTGKTKATCKVTVTSPEPVRFAYPSENSAVKGVKLQLIAVTDTSRTAVTFQASGPSTETFTAKESTTESRNSRYGLPTNTVKVFKCDAVFPAAGTYTVKASAGSSESYTFNVFVKPAPEDVNASAYGERWCSTEGLKIIANFEGSVPEIEDDTIASKNPTVGYGTVIRPGEAFYNNMTSSELFGMLVKTANYGGYTSTVNKFRQNNNLKMSQAQFDALVSLVFNCGSAPLDTTQYDLPRVMLNMVEPPAISETQTYPGKTNIGATVMYKSAELTAGTVATIPYNTRVTVVDSYVMEARHQRWYKVKYGNNSGWVPAGYISLDASGLVHDLAYSDAASLSNNFLAWHKSGSSCIEGLLWRRVAEAKIFFFGDYAEAYHSHPNYAKNTYKFNFPSCEKHRE